MKKTKPTPGLSFTLLIKRCLWLLLSAFLLVQCWYFVQVCWFNFYQPKTTAMMSHQLKRLQSKKPTAQLKYQWVEINRISHHLQRAVVAAEDDKFVQHHGYDWDGIKLAFEKNLKQGKIVAGGSTITQQLAKNLFLSNHKTPWRKGQEAIITLMIELVMSKQRILTLYLNLVEWGNGVFGAQAASRYYFRHSAQSLSRREAAKLAAMLPNPRYYDKHRETNYLNKKTRRLLNRMHMSRLPSDKTKP